MPPPSIPDWVFPGAVVANRAGTRTVISAVSYGTDDALYSVIIEGVGGSETHLLDEFLSGWDWTGDWAPRSLLASSHVEGSMGVSGVSWVYVGALLADRHNHRMPSVVQEILLEGGLQSHGLVRLTQGDQGSPGRDLVLTTSEVLERFEPTGLDPLPGDLDNRHTLALHRAARRLGAGNSGPPTRSTVYDRILDDSLDLPHAGE